MLNKNQSIRTLIESSNYPVFYTGNSISTLSGVPSFNEEIFGHRIMDILDVNFYNDNRNLFHKALIEIFEWTKFTPTIIHDFLAELDFPIITEAIDGLHQKAGNRNVIELHGNLHSLLCKNCSSINQENELFLKPQSFNCLVCNKSISSNIVLSGESINYFHNAVNEIYKADLLIVLGSNLSQWPANKIVTKAQKSGCTVLNFPVIDINVLSLF